MNSLTKLSEKRLPEKNIQPVSQWMHCRLMAMISRIKYGAIRVTDYRGCVQLAMGEMDCITADIRIDRPFNMLRCVLQKGSIGFAESYMRGDWSSENLANLLELLLKNRPVLIEEFAGSWLGRCASIFKHRRNSNTISKSRKNIAYHYDLGNAFYKLWLDSTMTYSSALFDEKLTSLEQAQKIKYSVLLDSLKASSPSNILEVGCGWGAFAEVAASQGHHVTGLTLSEEQKAYADQLAKNKGLEEKCLFKLQDYRQENGQYDHIVSIEMLEAVGTSYWPTYFATLNRCLKPGGRAAIQVIVMNEEFYEEYDNATDFIQQYIFPGGKLPTVNHLKALSRNAGFNIVNKRHFGMDYKETLLLWRNRFEARLNDVRRLGYDERFIRMWRYYLSYCEAGFVHGRIDVVHWLIEKPHCPEVV